MSSVKARLGIEVPIIQGPFGGGLSTPALVAEVANRGGLGSYGAHILAPEDILATAAQIRAQTEGPFALNLWLSNDDPGGLDLDAERHARLIERYAPYFEELGLAPPPMPTPGQLRHELDDQLAAVLEARPAAFSFVFGVPSAAILAECRRRDIATIGAATSIAEAKALDAAGVDLIVATGFEAGGHRPSFLATAERSLMGTMSLVPLIADRVRAPVIAAGGIVDGRGVQAALSLGAQAAQLGTAFLACEESGADPAHRALLFDSAAQQTVLTRAFTGRLARGIRNRWTDEVGADPAGLPPFPLQSWFVSQLKNAAFRAGRTDLVALWCGQSAPNLQHRRVADLMQALVATL